MLTTNDIAHLITDYAHAYGRMHDLQAAYKHVIPPGDQKTGSVGEFYAKLYVEQLYPTASVEFGGHSNKAWDIRVAPAEGQPWLIQVKTTSAFSRYRKLSPVHHGWQKLFVLHLNKSLFPDGFWIIEGEDLLAPTEILTESYAPRPDQNNKKSGKLRFGPNRIAEMYAQLANVLDLPAHLDRQAASKPTGPCH